MSEERWRPIQEVLDELEEEETERLYRTMGFPAVRRVLAGARPDADARRVGSSGPRSRAAER